MYHFLIFQHVNTIFVLSCFSKFWILRIKDPPPSPQWPESSHTCLKSYHRYYNKWKGLIVTDYTRRGNDQSFLNRKQRNRMHNHLRQNMCPEHPNRNLANGPNHPGPGPEEIPMVDVRLWGFLILLLLIYAYGFCSLQSFFFFSHCSISQKQYISKNVPATERVIRPATEGSFPASHASSRSHNSSTRVHSSTHR